MSFLSRLIIFLIETTNTLLGIYTFVVIVACLISFVNPDPYNPIVRFLRRVTEPAFSFIRRKLPFVVVAGLDFAPIVLIVAIRFVTSVLLPEVGSFVLGSKF